MRIVQLAGWTLASTVVAGETEWNLAIGEVNYRPSCVCPGTDHDPLHSEIRRASSMEEAAGTPEIAGLMSARIGKLSRSPPHSGCTSTARRCWPGRAPAVQGQTDRLAGADHHAGPVCRFALCDPATRNLPVLAWKAACCQMP